MKFNMSNIPTKRLNTRNEWLYLVKAETRNEFLVM